jgi:hypothetical protein
MPFTQIIKHARGKTSGNHEPTIRMSCSLNEGKEKPRALSISISLAAFTSVGFTAFANENTKARISIEEGWGDDAGFLLLTPIPASDILGGYSCTATGKNSQMLQTSVPISKLIHYVPNEIPIPHEEVEFTVQDNSFLVQCPDWLRYNPQSVTNDMLATAMAAKAKLEAERQPVVAPLPHWDDEVKEVEVVVKPPRDTKGKPLHLNRGDRRRLASAVAKGLTR